VSFEQVAPLGELYVTWTGTESVDTGLVNTELVNTGPVDTGDTDSVNELTESDDDQ
jgi:hypothetical protein